PSAAADDARAEARRRQVLAFVERAAGGGAEPRRRHLARLSFGVFSRNRVARLGWRCGEHVLDLAAAGVCAAPALEDLFAEGRREWETVTERALAADAAGAEPRYSLGDVTLHVPFAVADFVDFYTSLEHATNMGRILRPGGEALLPN